MGSGWLNALSGQELRELLLFLELPLSLMAYKYLTRSAHIRTSMMKATDVHKPGRCGLALAGFGSLHFLRLAVWRSCELIFRWFILHTQAALHSPRLLTAIKTSMLTWGTIYPEVKPPLCFQKLRYQPSKVVSMYPDSGYPSEHCNQPMSSARVRELIAGLGIGPTMSGLTLGV